MVSVCLKKSRDTVVLPKDVGKFLGCGDVERLSSLCRVIDGMVSSHKTWGKCERNYHCLYLNGRVEVGHCHKQIAEEACGFVILY